MGSATLGSSCKGSPTPTRPLALALPLHSAPPWRVGGMCPECDHSRHNARIWRLCVDTAPSGGPFGHSRGKVLPSSASACHSLCTHATGAVERSRSGVDQLEPPCCHLCLGVAGCSPSVPESGCDLPGDLSGRVACCRSRWIQCCWPTPHRGLPQVLCQGASQLPQRSLLSSLRPSHLPCSPSKVALMSLASSVAFSANNATAPCLWQWRMQSRRSSRLSALL